MLGKLPNPGFPAVLLIPLVMGVWIGIWTLPVEIQGTQANYGIPFKFKGSFSKTEPVPHSVYEFRARWLLVDIAIALSVAYALSIAVEWGVLEPMRERRTSLAAPNTPPQETGGLGVTSKRTREY